MTTDTSGFTKVIILGSGAIGSYYGSMLSRKTDVLLIGVRANGKVSELGRRHGVAAPVNDVLTSLIRFMEGKEWS